MYHIVRIFCNLLLLLNIVFQIIHIVKSRSRLFILIVFGIRLRNKSQFCHSLVQTATMNILVYVFSFPLKRVWPCDTM